MIIQKSKVTDAIKILKKNALKLIDIVKNIYILMSSCFW